MLHAFAMQSIWNRNPFGLTGWMTSRRKLLHYMTLEHFGVPLELSKALLALPHQESRQVMLQHLRNSSLHREAQSVDLESLVQEAVVEVEEVPASYFDEGPAPKRQRVSAPSASSAASSSQTLALAAGSPTVVASGSEELVTIRKGLLQSLVDASERATAAAAHAVTISRMARDAFEEPRVLSLGSKLLCGFVLASPPHPHTPRRDLANRRSTAGSTPSRGTCGGRSTAFEAGARSPATAGRRSGRRILSVGEKGRRKLRPTCAQSCRSLCGR